MAEPIHRRYDLLPGAATLVAVGTAIVQGLLLAKQGDRPALWFVGCLAVAASLCAYAATRPANQRSSRSRSAPSCCSCWAS